MGKKGPNISELASQFAPLDAIRQEEAANARRIIQARQHAEAILHKAREQAESLKQEAYQSGLRDGQQASFQKIASTKNDAECVLGEARTRARALQAQAESLIGPAASWAESVILGLKGGGSGS